MSITTVFRSRMARVGLPLVAAGVLVAAGTAGATAASASAAPMAAPSTSTTATAAATTIMVSNGHLTDGTGRTVYLWVADPAGMSTCSGACAALWPPVPANGTPTAGTGVDATKLTTIQRSDGTSQIAYAGHALYYYAPDKSAGQTTGQGSDSFGAKWWEVSPAGQAITSANGTSGGSAPGSPAGPTTHGLLY